MFVCLLFLFNKKEKNLPLSPQLTSQYIPNFGEQINGIRPHTKSVVYIHITSANNGPNIEPKRTAAD